MREFKNTPAATFDGAQFAAAHGLDALAGEFYAVPDGPTTVTIFAPGSVPINAAVVHVMPARVDKLSDVEWAKLSAAEKTEVLRSRMKGTT